MKTRMIKVEFIDEYKSQMPTASENKFKSLLTNFLEEHKINVSFEQNKIIHINTSDLNELVDGLLTLHTDIRNEIKKTYRGYHYIQKKPDFIFEDYGLIIEIDGKIHDNYSNKIKKDVHRDYIYKAADYDVYRIDNKDIYNVKARSRIFKDLKTYFKSPQDQASKNERIRKQRVASDIYEQHQLKKEHVELSNKEILITKRKNCVGSRKYIQKKK